jgi:hypothetical protein
LTIISPASTPESLKGSSGMLIRGSISCCVMECLLGLSGIFGSSGITLLASSEGLVSQPCLRKYSVRIRGAGRESVLELLVWFRVHEGLPSLKGRCQRRDGDERKSDSEYSKDSGVHDGERIKKGRESGVFE